VIGAPPPDCHCGRSELRVREVVRGGAVEDHPHDPVGERRGLAGALVIHG